MSSPRGNRSAFLCECGKTYNSNQNLQSHKRRYCRLLREASASEFEGKCPECSRQFNGYANMRQHMKKAHPIAYNNSLQRESRNARHLWTEDEEDVLAKAEAEYSGNNLLDHLVSLSTRSKDAIKGRRRNPKYIEKVARFKNMLQQNEVQRSASELEFQRQESEEEQEYNDILRLDGALLELINNIEGKELKDIDVQFRHNLSTTEKTRVIPLFEEWCQSWCVKIKKSSSNRTSELEVLQSKIADPKLSKSRKRALEFKLAQLEYRQDRKTYARRLIDGLGYTADNNRPSSQEIEGLYADIFGSKSPEDDETITDRYEEMTEISQPITEKEIQEALETSMSNTPGPDGFTLEDVKRISMARLLLLFNTILYLEYIPSVFKVSRTVLIPKTSSELHLAKNWRPITISAVLLRVLNKILAKRLSAINICNRQRGFQKIDGCFANYATLETIISHYRKQTKPLTIISLDLAKAFDMVSHQSVHRATKRLHIDVKTRNVIQHNYEGLETELVCGRTSICKCPIRRGVKQGDPMSPFLFNAVIDELLVKLESEFSGIKLGEAKVSSLAYADDLVLLANTPEDGQRMLDYCLGFFTKRGLKVNAMKCSSIILKTVPGKKKLYTLTEPALKVGEEHIPVVSIGEQMRYLGQMFDSEGISGCSGEALAEQLSRIKKAPLKPQQKLTIIKEHLLPRYIATLQRPNVAKRVLQKIDRSIRSALKKILHLNIHCANPVFYATIKTGGLGVFQFSKMIPIITLSRWNRLKDRSTLLQETYSLSDSWVRRYQRMIGDGQSTKEQVHKQQEELLHKSFSGRGLNQVKHHPACNSYIRNPPKYWTGQDFVRALLLRFNLLPCQGIPSNPPEQRRCRAGCDKVESLSHILQHCPLSHWWRINRHNFVVHRLSTFAKRKGWKVNIEQHIRCTDGLLKKPDLILEKGNRVIVTDVGINWGGEISLGAQHQNKTAIYSTEGFVNKIKAMYPDKSLYILPLIVGARGTWCVHNKSLIEHLELSHSQVADIITTTLRGSWTIHQQYMRHVWRQRFSCRHNNNIGASR